VLNIYSNRHVFDNFISPVASGYPIFLSLIPHQAHLIFRYIHISNRSTDSQWISFNLQLLISQADSHQLQSLSGPTSSGVVQKSKQYFKHHRNSPLYRQQGIETQNGPYRQQQTNRVYIPTAVFPFELPMLLGNSTFHSYVEKTISSPHHELIKPLKKKKPKTQHIESCHIIKDKTKMSTNCPLQVPPSVCSKCKAPTEDQPALLEAVVQVTLRH